MMVDRGGKGFRTLAVLPCVIGVERDSWKRGSFAVYPFRRYWNPALKRTPLMRSVPEGRHIIHLSLNWAAAIQTGRVESAEEIAAEVGLTGGRVRQIVRLSELHPEIVTFLQELRGVPRTKQFSERRIRSICPLPLLNQMRAFEKEFQVRTPD